MKTVVVIGGGITGLSTMYYLQKAATEKSLDVRLMLIEAEETLGGKIHTVYDGDFIIETGADSIVVRKENITSFIKEINLEDQVVYNATGKSFLHTDHGIEANSRGFDVWDTDEYGIFSENGINFCRRKGRGVKGFLYQK